MPILLVLFVCAALALVAEPAGGADHAVILQYHHVSEQTPASTSVSPERFAAHLDWLAEHHFHIWSLPDVVSHLRSGQALPDSCVVLTFDDAYANVYSEAWPLVRRRGWSMTVFVPTHAIDDGGSDYMSWDQLREMAAAGVIFASHGHRHDYLARRRAHEDELVWCARARNDIEVSLRRLREELGGEPGLFAWPYGEFVPALEAIIDELGLVGLGQHSGPVWSGSDFGALPRFPMAAVFASMEQFSVKVASLPLPVVAWSPRSSLVPAGDGAPELRIELEAGDYVATDLTAYAGAQGRIDLKPIEGVSGVYRIKANLPLPAGRSRYNITAPAVDGSRFYWFSKPWLNLNEGSRE